MKKHEKRSGEQERSRDQQQAQNKDWEKRIADRAELAKKAGAHVVVPTSSVTRMILQIAQQMDVLYQQLSQKSGLFGSVSNEKRMEVETQLAEHLIGMSLTAEKMAKTVGGRARYYHPRELEPFLKGMTQTNRSARKPGQAKAKPAPAMSVGAEEKPPVPVIAEEKTPVPVRVGKKVVPPPTAEVPAAAETLAATA